MPARRSTYLRLMCLLTAGFAGWATPAQDGANKTAGAPLAQEGALLQGAWTEEAGTAGGVEQGRRLQAKSAQPGLIMRSTLNAAAVGGSYLQHFSPWSSVRHMRLSRSVGSKPPHPYGMLAFQCAHWSFYGILGWLITGDWHRLVLLCANLPGTLLGVYYTTIYARNCDDEGLYRQLKSFFSCSFVILGLEATLAVLGANWFQLVGGASTFLSVGLNATPLFTVRTVLRTRSVCSMPAGLAFASLATNTLWLAYGLLLGDVFLVATNAVSFLASFLACCLILRFHPLSRAARGAPAIGAELADALPQKAVDLELAVLRIASAVGGKGRSKGSSCSVAGQGSLQVVDTIAKRSEGTSNLTAMGLPVETKIPNSPEGQASEGSFSFASTELPEFEMLGTPDSKGSKGSDSFSSLVSIAGQRSLKVADVLDGNGSEASHCFIGI